jgi:quinol-cytochrome oxidoreductase complex cytochrome b subunit
MRLKPVLTLAALYQAIVGIGMVFVPKQFGIGAVPADASPALIAFLRIFGGPLVGIAVLNWLARNLEPSPARRTIALANLVGFGTITLVDVWSVATGAARPVAKLFLVIHLLFTIAFVVAARGRAEIPR